MNFLFIVISLLVIIVLLLIFLYIKRTRAKNKFNVFSGEGGVYSRGGGFFKGILHSFISGKSKRKSGEVEDAEFYGGNGKKGLNYGVKRNVVEKKQKSIKKPIRELVKETKIKKIFLKKSVIPVEKIKHTKVREKIKKSITKPKKTNEGSVGGEKEGKSGFGLEGDKKSEKIDLKKVLRGLKKTNVGLILDSLKKEENSFIVDKLFKMNFSSKKNFLKTLKEELVTLLKETNKELKSRVSKIRKTGKKVRNLDLTLMSVPLKIKLFEATISKKDFDKAISLMQEIEKSIKPYEKEESNEEQNSVKINKKN